jgi:hypothetical protein
MNTTNTVTSPLGLAMLTDAELTEVVSTAVGRPVRLGEWRVTALPVSSGAISTESVLQVHGTAFAGDEQLPWSVLVKVLRSPRHWPGIVVVPEPFRQSLIDGYRWQVEAQALTTQLPGIMPPGMRTPGVYRLDDLGDDRSALWMEWVDVATTPWDTTRFRRAARLLGRLAARRTGSALTREPTADLRSGLRELAAGPLAMRYVPMLSDRSVCPLLSPYVDGRLRADLLALSERIPAMLDRLEQLPQAIGHGDACPQNLLTPADAPETLVAIDFSWQHPEAIGFDLGQLMIGLAHTGDLTADELPALHDEVLSAFVDGLRAEHCDVDIDDVRYGFDASMVIRSAFMSLPWDQLHDEHGPEFANHLAQRVALTRYLADVGLTLPEESNQTNL